MIGGQIVPAFMAALMSEGVKGQQIEDAVAKTLDCELGASIADLAGRPADERGLVRAFVFEQASRLEKA